MKTYYLDTLLQPTGKRQLHSGSCLYLPGFLGRKYVGEFRTPDEALRIAKTTYGPVVVCNSCCDLKGSRKNKDNNVNDYGTIKHNN